MMSAVKNVDESDEERTDTEATEKDVGKPVVAKADGDEYVTVSGLGEGGTTLNTAFEGVSLDPLDSTPAPPTNASTNEIGPGDNVKISQDALSPTSTPSPQVADGPAQFTASPAHSPSPSRGTTLSATSTTTAPAPTLPSSSNATKNLLLPKTGANSSTASLESVLALHSARRMRPSSPSPVSSAPPSKSSTLAPPKQSTSSSSTTAEENKSGGKQRRGVSIPSQRRFLFYWSQILSDAAPRGFWGLGITPTQSDLLGVATKGERPSASADLDRMQKVRIKGITVRMLDPGGTKATALKVVNKILASTTGGKVRIHPITCRNSILRSGEPDISTP